MVSIFNILPQTRLSRGLGLGPRRSAEVGGAFALDITWLRASSTRLVYTLVMRKFEFNTNYPYDVWCQDDELWGQNWLI